MGGLGDEGHEGRSVKPRAALEPTAAPSLCGTLHLIKKGSSLVEVSGEEVEFGALRSRPQPARHRLARRTHDFYFLSLSLPLAAPLFLK